MLTSEHQDRWDKAKAFFQSVIDAAKQHQAVLYFDGEVTNIDNLKITEDTITLQFDDWSGLVILFEADPELDHGLYEESDKYISDMRSRMKLYVEVQF